MAPPKGSRRGPSLLSNVTNASGPATPARTAKSTKLSMIVRLKVPSSFLTRLQGKQKSTKDSQTKSASSQAPRSATGVTLKLKTSSDTPSSREEQADGSQSPDRSALAPDEKGLKLGLKRSADAIASDDGKPKPKGPQRKRLKV